MAAENPREDAPVVAKQVPKNLDGKKWWRGYARHIRDVQWQLMERMEEHGTLWICPWNKRGLPAGEDEFRDGLLGWMEKGTWFAQHADWFVIGEWDDDRYATPYQLTDAGREALNNRELYDMEPVEGGMVEPGWMATPGEPGTAVQLF